MPCSCVVRFKVLRGKEEKAAGELNSEERALETKFKSVGGGGVCGWGLCPVTAGAVAVAGFGLASVIDAQQS